MRETEGYRPQLELLTDMFPARAAITVTECQAALHCTIDELYQPPEESA